MRLPNINTLARISAGGAILVCFGHYYFRGRIEENLKSSEYYKKSFEILRSNQGIVYYFGAPIKDGKLNLKDNKNNFCTGKEAQFEVPIKGSKKRGILYLWASKDEYKNPWIINRLEVGIDDEPNRRILLYNLTTQSD